MADSKGWLTVDTVAHEANAVVDAIRGAIRQYQAPRKFYDGESDIYNAVRGRHFANSEILKDWFYASIGVVDVLEPKLKETYYLSRAYNASYFCEHNVVPWTNWLGDAYVRAKAAIQSSGLPAKLEYGPPSLRDRYPLGPVVDYTFEDGCMREIILFFGTERFDVLGIAPAMLKERAPGRFGLKQIIRTIDIDQNDQIRGPMQGIFILTGGPGVGKTTVALHRIPYLINEQVPYEQRRRMEESDEPLFFSQLNTLVVVWKTHLVPYLRKCLDDLDLKGFPEANVRHVDDWVDFQIRRYVPIGPKRGDYRLRLLEPDAVAEAKLSLAESDIELFMNSNRPAAAESVSAIKEDVQKIRELVKESGEPFPYVFRPETYHFSVEGVESVVEEIRKHLHLPPSTVEEDDEDASPASQTDGGQEESAGAHGGRERSPRRVLGRLRTREMRRLSRYVDLLHQFYRSDIAKKRLRAAYKASVVDQVYQALEQQEKKREITRADCYLLLWMVHIVTRGGRGRSRQHQPLPRYSHVLIDEAQYYRPLVLRLFADLAQLPRGVMTIVGDLEQRITSKGGLASWADVGLRVPLDNIAKLATNYRWSRRVFEFLEKVREVAGITETLKAPRSWYSGEGWQPEICDFTQREDELGWIADRILKLKNSPESEHSTVAVVVPETLVGQAKTQLIQNLRSYAINSRWAEGEDVKESIDRVIVTNLDSIVGLEFDSVFLVGADEALRQQSREEIQAVWVALTRARQFICVTRVGVVKIFDSQRFKDHRISAGGS